MSDQYFIGIDPGKSGALVALHKNGVEKHVIPMIGKEYDIRGCVEILESYPNKHVVLEDVNYHAAKGRTSAAIMGEGKMLWKALLIALDVPHTLVVPKGWQKEMWQGIPIQWKSGKKKRTKDTKAMSLLAAKRLFPKVDLTKSVRSTVPHDGITDALLMAEYCHRNFAKKFTK